jgi:hypothetical protein
MCRARTVTNSQLAAITNLVNRNPMMTASDVAPEVGMSPRKTRFYMTQLRQKGWIPPAKNQPAEVKPQSEASHQHELSVAMLRRLSLIDADRKWAEALNGRSYA